MPLFQVFFDGGCGVKMYGSWEVVFCGFSKKASRVVYETEDFPKTCNVAEYMALTGALSWLQTVKEKAQYRVEISGDSQLVLKQLSGDYRCKLPHLKELLDRCRELLKEFGDWSTVWKPRMHSVSRFGH